MRYDSLLQSIQQGGALDLDKKGDFVVRSSSGVLFRHVHDPEEYATGILAAITKKMDACTDENEKKGLKQLADSVGKEYRELRKEHRLKLGKASFLTTISKILHFFHKTATPHQAVRDYFSEMAGPQGAIPVDTRAISKHRNPPEDFLKSYNGANNVTAAQNRYFSEMQKQPPADWEVMKLPDSSPEKRQAVAFIDKIEERFEAKFKEKVSFEDGLKRLSDDDELRPIISAHMKEIAARMAYRKDLPAKIEQGAYNPRIIRQEINQELQVGRVDPIPVGMSSLKDVKEEIKIELDRIRQVPGVGLTKDQARYIRHDINELLELYQEAYPDKSPEQQYILARDALRAIVYQEMHDKSSFTGSDHGSKHVHHNTQNADGLHEHMEERVDYTAKDRFLEHLIHAYHDMGYTVGLGAVNFDCCKDHPFIGARMLEDEKEYFVELLDADSFEVLHDSVLCHAIALFDMTPEGEVNGLHRNMVRAVTSISDACAVTYDRKTQEFWEQPGALIALSRLKLFLTQYPAYKGKLSNPAIIEDEWAGLDRNNIMDKMAHDIFQGTKAELIRLAENYDLAPDRVNLFKQAINSQFNAFTANTTLGQYGAVLSGVEAVPNEGHENGGAKYIPQFNMAPSLMYGVLRDLFGADQANEAFKKLIEEAGGKLKDLQQEIEEMGRQIGANKKPEPKKKRLGAAIFNVEAHHDVQTEVKTKDKAFRKHMARLQKGLVNVTNAVASIYQQAQIEPGKRQKILDELEAIRKGDKKMSFSDLLGEISVEISPEEATLQLERWKPVMDKASEFNKALQESQKVEERYRQLFAQVPPHLQKPLQEAYRECGFVMTRDNAVGKLVAKEGLNVDDLDKNIQASKNELIRNEQTIKRVKDALVMLLMTTKEYDFMMAASKSPAPKKAFYEHL